MSLVSVTVLGGISSISETARGAVEVDLDLTVLGQMALFVVLMLVLKPVLFDPMLQLFEEREKRIAGAKLQARSIDEKSAAALTQYETAMGKARAEANVERDRLRAEGAKMENELIGTARAAASKTLDEGRAKLAKERSDIEEKMKEEVRVLARDIATSALGREVRG